MRRPRANSSLTIEGVRLARKLYADAREHGRPVRWKVFGKQLGVSPNAVRMAALGRCYRWVQP